MSSVRVTTLPNGLRIASDTMNGVETVSLGCWVGVGTRNERADMNGVAHLCEHMMFKGTASRSAYAISEQIENVGGHLNAYTTREHTAYYAKVLADDAPLALDIISDMIQNSLLDDEELTRERAVVIQEIGQAIDTPDDIIFDHFQTTAYPDQALGRPVLGSVKTVGNLEQPTLAEYIRRHYGAPGIVVSAAGRIEHDRFVEQAERAFRNLPASSDARAEEACYRAGEYRESRDLEQLHMIIGFNGIDVFDPGYYAQSVLSTLLGGGMSSRLFQEVREKRGLAYTIYSFVGTYRDGGLFGIYAGTGPDQVGELVPILCHEIMRVVEDVTEDELARARAQLKAGTLMALESTMARCEHLGQQLLVYGRPVPTEEVVRKINAVDLEAVRLAAARLRLSKPTVAAIGPLDYLESYDRIAARLT
ncbi:MAG: pitrilysin family protein [Rhodospirillaceae bacterium]